MGDNDDIEKLLRHAIGGLDDDEGEKNDPKTPLDELAIHYNKRHEFKVGDMVKWKDGMKQNSIPKYGQEAVVVEILPQPIFNNDPDKVGTPYWMEPNDIRIGIKMKGQFIIFHFDSRRFEPIVKKKH